MPNDQFDIRRPFDSQVIGVGDDAARGMLSDDLKPVAVRRLELPR